MIRARFNTSSPRVAITGIGIVAPNGIGKEAFWHSLKEAISGIARITIFDPAEHTSQIAGEVKGFDPFDYIPRDLKPQRHARHTQFAMAATVLAVKDAHIDIAGIGTAYAPVPVILGISGSAADVIDAQRERMDERGAQRVSPQAVDALTPQAASGMVATLLGGHTRAMTVSTACSGGLDSAWVGAEMIRSGAVDVAVVGGADSQISPFFMAAMSSAGISSTHNDSPETASRPFDKDRDTGVVSEGGGVLILENEEHALARGAEVYARLTAYGTQVDTDRSIPASGLSDTMTAALGNAQLSPPDIDYICAHGPGHPVLDIVETEMIKQVFGDRAYEIPISSIKGVLGNPLAAAGIFQIAACCMAMKDGVVPPTANLDHPDPSCDLDYVPLRARSLNIRTSLINSHGVGGGNSSLILEAAEG